MTCMNPDDTTSPAPVNAATAAWDAVVATWEAADGAPTAAEIADAQARTREAMKLVRTHDDRSTHAA